MLMVGQHRTGQCPHVVECTNKYLFFMSEGNGNDIFLAKRKNNFTSKASINVKYG